MARSWTFGKKIAAGFALSFVLLAAIGAIAYRSIAALSQTSYSVAHTHVVLERLASVLSLLKDAETGQRGYVITGDESFLGPYQAAVPAIATTVNDLRELTSDPAQQKRIGQAEPLIAAKLSELKRIIEMRRNRDVEQATKAIQAGEGKRLMDDLRRLLGEMEREERDLLKQRAGEVDAATTGATLAIAIGTLLCLLLVIAAGFT
ncbi:MAG TPA: CHASE3 domain-containing protein, partial [Coriobacteriia bacterium]